MNDQHWRLRRELSKLNYSIHTETVKEYLIPKLLSGKRIEGSVYASEADLLNMAVFAMTAREWQLLNPNLKGNMRDHATLEQLLILSNIKNLNSELIRQNIPQEERLFQLNEVAVRQMGILLNQTGNRLLINKIGQLPEIHNKVAVAFTKHLKPL